MSSIQIDAGAVFNAAMTLLSEQDSRDSPAIARLDALARMATFGIKQARTVWIDLSLDDFLLLEPALTRPPRSVSD